MLNLRNTTPATEQAKDAAIERASKAADKAAKSAKEISGQLERWAKDGYGSAREAMKSGQFKWGAASLGFGALVGGLFALWQRNAKAQRRPTRNTMAVRARAKQSMRAAPETNGGEVPAVRKTAKRTRRSRQAANV
jgi:hypothetical protein